MQNLFRHRTQAWTHRIPSHLHYGKDRVRIPYDHRYCPSPGCPPQTLGDELHILTACAPTDPFWQTQIELFNGLARLFQMHHFSSYGDLDRARIMLGTPPVDLPRKYMPLWQEHAPAQCAAFARALYEYLLRVPQPGLQASSSEESDGYVYETSGLIVCRGSVTPPRAGGGMVPPSALHGDLNVPSLHDP